MPRSGRSRTTTGSPGGSTTRLDRLKDRLSDPVGDRLVESLRIAREVGGTDLGHLLRTLSGFLREDARTRAELETRQSWTVNAARLAVAAPWAVLAMLSTNPESVAAYSTATGDGGPGRRWRAHRGGLLGDGADRQASRGPAGAAVSGLARSGAVLGFVLGLGLALVWLGLPRHRRPGLAGRVLPYLRDTPRPSRLLDDSRPAGGALGAGGGVRSSATSAGSSSGSWAGPTRCAAASCGPEWRRTSTGSGPSRCSGARWVRSSEATCGLLALALRDAGGGHRRDAHRVGLGLGVTGADYLLSRRAARREARMLAEFPTVAELLALAVGAGEGAVGALDRVCRLSHGELAGELRRCLADARAGANLPTALQGLADRTGLASLRRFVDGVVIAVERGTPLADVLRAQAQDVREEGRRALMEAGGRKEIAMMVPVVFLILPVTVLFAVFPGFTFFRFTL